MEQGELDVHAQCVACWNTYNPRRAIDPTRYRSGSAEVCCWCAKDTASGIYVTGDPRNTPCHGEHALRGAASERG